MANNETTGGSNSRPSRQRDESSARTAYAWHFRKLMVRLEAILAALKGIERAVDGSFRERGSNE